MEGMPTVTKAGYTPQAIFEATGFEPIQQNQVVGTSLRFLRGWGIGYSAIALFKPGSDICTSCACSPSQNGLPPQN